MDRNSIQHTSFEQYNDRNSNTFVNRKKHAVYNTHNIITLDDSKEVP